MECGSILSVAEVCVTLVYLLWRVVDALGSSLTELNKDFSKKAPRWPMGAAGGAAADDSSKPEPTIT